MTRDTKSAKTFTCELCQGIFDEEPDWSEADRTEEFVRNFGHLPEQESEGVARVCDVCYKRMGLK